MAKDYSFEEQLAKNWAQGPTSEPSSEQAQVPAKAPTADVFQPKASSGKTSDFAETVADIVSAPIKAIAAPVRGIARGVDSAISDEKQDGLLGGILGGVNTGAKAISSALSPEALDVTGRRAVVGATDALIGLTNRTQAKATREATRSARKASKYEEGSEEYTKYMERANAADAIARAEAEKNRAKLGENYTGFIESSEADLASLSKEGQFIANLGYSAGQMAPDIAVSLATGGVLKGLGVGAKTAQTLSSAAGLGTMFANVYGNTYTENRDSGYDIEASSKNATAKAAIEVATEILGGGLALTDAGGLTEATLGLAGNAVSGLGHIAKDDIGAKALGGLTIGIGKLLSNDFFQQIIGEGAEEWMSEFLGPYADRMTLDPEASLSTREERMTAFLGGALMGLGLEAPHQMINAVHAAGRKLTQREDGTIVAKDANGNTQTVVDPNRKAGNPSEKTIQEQAKAQVEQKAKDKEQSAFETFSADILSNPAQPLDALYDKYPSIPKEAIDSFYQRAQTSGQTSAQKLTGDELEIAKKLEIDTIKRTIQRATASELPALIDDSIARAQQKLGISLSEATQLYLQASELERQERVQTPQMAAPQGMPVINVSINGALPANGQQVVYQATPAGVAPTQQVAYQQAPGAQPVYQPGVQLTYQSAPNVQTSYAPDVIIPPEQSRVSPGMQSATEQRTDAEDIQAQIILYNMALTESRAVFGSKEKGPGLFTLLLGRKGAEYGDLEKSIGGFEPIVYHEGMTQKELDDIIAARGASIKDITTRSDAAKEFAAKYDYDVTEGAQKRTRTIHVLPQVAKLIADGKADQVPADQLKDFFDMEIDGSLQGSGYLRVTDPSGTVRRITVDKWAEEQDGKVWSERTQSDKINQMVAFHGMQLAAENDTRKFVDKLNSDLSRAGIETGALQFSVYSQPAWNTAKDAIIERLRTRLGMSKEDAQRAASDALARRVAIMLPGNSRVIYLNENYNRSMDSTLLSLAIPHEMVEAAAARNQSMQLSNTVARLAELLGFDYNTFRAEVKRLYPELTSEDEINREVNVRFLGYCLSSMDVMAELGQASQDAANGFVNYLQNKLDAQGDADNRISLALRRLMVDIYSALSGNPTSNTASKEAQYHAAEVKAAVETMRTATAAEDAQAEAAIEAEAQPAEEIIPERTEPAPAPAVEPDVSDVITEKAVPAVEPVQPTTEEVIVEKTLPVEMTESEAVDALVPKVEATPEVVAPTVSEDAIPIKADSIAQSSMPEADNFKASQEAKDQIDTVLGKGRAAGTAKTQLGRLAKNIEKWIVASGENTEALLQAAQDWGETYGTGIGGIFRSEAYRYLEATGRIDSEAVRLADEIESEISNVMAESEDVEEEVYHASMDETAPETDDSSEEEPNPRKGEDEVADEEVLTAESEAQEEAAESESEPEAAEEFALGEDAVPWDEIDPDGEESRTANETQNYPSYYLWTKTFNPNTGERIIDDIYEMRYDFASGRVILIPRKGALSHLTDKQNEQRKAALKRLGFYPSFYVDTLTAKSDRAVEGLVSATEDENEVRPVTSDRHYTNRWVMRGKRAEVFWLRHTGTKLSELEASATREEKDYGKATRKKQAEINAARREAWYNGDFSVYDDHGEFVDNYEDGVTQMPFPGIPGAEVRRDRYALNGIETDCIVVTPMPGCTIAAMHIDQLRRMGFSKQKADGSLAVPYYQRNTKDRKSYEAGAGARIWDQLLVSGKMALEAATTEERDRILNTLPPALAPGPLNNVHKKYEVEGTKGHLYAFYDNGNIYIGINRKVKLLDALNRVIWGYSDREKAFLSGRLNALNPGRGGVNNLNIGLGFEYIKGTPGQSGLMVAPFNTELWRTLVTKDVDGQNLMTRYRNWQVMEQLNGNLLQAAENNYRAEQASKRTLFDEVTHWNKAYGHNRAGVRAPKGAEIAVVQMASPSADDITSMELEATAHAQSPKERLDNLLYTEMLNRARQYAKTGRQDVNFGEVMNNIVEEYTKDFYVPEADITSLLAAEHNTQYAAMLSEAYKNVQRLTAQGKKANLDAEIRKLRSRYKVQNKTTWSETRQKIYDKYGRSILVRWPGPTKGKYITYAVPYDLTLFNMLRGDPATRKAREGKGRRTVQERLGLAKGQRAVTHPITIAEGVTKEAKVILDKYPELKGASVFFAADAGENQGYIAIVPQNYQPDGATPNIVKVLPGAEIKAMRRNNGNYEYEIHIPDSVENRHFFGIPDPSDRGTPMFKAMSDITLAEMMAHNASDRQLWVPEGKRAITSPVTLTGRDNAHGQQIVAAFPGLQNSRVFVMKRDASDIGKIVLVPHRVYYNTEEEAIAAGREILNETSALSRRGASLAARFPGATVEAIPGEITKNGKIKSYGIELQFGNTKENRDLFGGLENPEKPGVNLYAQDLDGSYWQTFHASELPHLGYEAPITTSSFEIETEESDRGWASGAVDWYTDYLEQTMAARRVMQTGSLFETAEDIADKAEQLKALVKTRTIERIRATNPVIAGMLDQGMTPLEIAQSLYQPKTPSRGNKVTTTYSAKVKPIPFAAQFDPDNTRLKIVTADEYARVIFGAENYISLSTRKQAQAHKDIARINKAIKERQAEAIQPNYRSGQRAQTMTDLDASILTEKFGAEAPAQTRPSAVDFAPKGASTAEPDTFYIRDLSGRIRQTSPERYIEETQGKQYLQSLTPENWDQQMQAYEEAERQADKLERTGYAKEAKALKKKAYDQYLESATAARERVRQNVIAQTRETLRAGEAELNDWAEQEGIRGVFDPKFIDLLNTAIDIQSALAVANRAELSTSEALEEVHAESEGTGRYILDLDEAPTPGAVALALAREAVYSSDRSKAEYVAQHQRDAERREAQKKQEANYRDWLDTNTRSADLATTTGSVSQLLRDTEGLALSSEQSYYYADNDAGKEADGRMIRAYYQNPNGESHFVLGETPYGLGLIATRQAPRIENSGVAVYINGNKRLDYRHAPTPAEARALTAKAKDILKQSKREAQVTFEAEPEAKPRKNALGKTAEDEGFTTGQKRPTVPFLWQQVEAAAQAIDPEHPEIVARRLVQSLGYDVVEYLGEDGMSFIVFGTDQLQEADPERFNAGEVSAFAVENTDDTTYEKADFDWDEAERIWKNMTEAQAKAKSKPEIRTNVNNNPDYAKQGWEHGYLRETSNPKSSLTDIPRKFDATQKNSRTLANATTDPRLSDEGLAAIVDAASRGEFAKAPITNKQEEEAARRSLINRKLLHKDTDGQYRLDVTAAVRSFLDTAEAKSYITEQKIVEGILLYNTLIDKAQATIDGEYREDLYARNISAAVDVLIALQQQATGHARAMQALTLLKKLGPLGRLYMAERAVEHLFAGLEKTKAGLPEELKGWKMPEDIREMFKTATNEAQYQEAEDALIEHIADKIPATIESRLTAYRYLCMLGNPRTHIRNVVSNAMMYFMRSVSDVVRSASEDVFMRNAKPGERHYSLVNRPTEELRNYARAQWDIYSEAMRYGGGKMDFSDKLKASLHKFGKTPAGKAMEALTKGNSNLLSGADLLFEKAHFVKAFSSWMAANGFTPEQFESASTENNAASRELLEQLAEGREYALQQALEMTYNNANVVANALSDLEKKTGPIGRLLLGGLIPFKRTPMNVLVQGIKYSPVGLAMSIYEAATGKSEKAMTDFASGVTGTTLFGLGIWLAMIGQAKAGGSESDREEYYDQMLGDQKYSITIGDTNYTLDWLTPASMPLFAGVEFVQKLNEMSDRGELEEEQTTQIGEDIVDMLAHMADPVMNLSMLQGLNEALNSYSDNKLGTMVKSAAESYALQFIPTLSGQMIRTMEDTRKTTYAPKDSDNLFGQTGEQFVNRLRNKSLVAHSLLGENEDYIDMWGRTEDRTDNLLGRVAEQFISPGYIKKTNKTEVDDRLAEVFAETKSPTVLPNMPQGYVTIDGKKDYLNAREYRDYKVEVGELSYAGLDSAFQSSLFDTLSAEGKGKVVSNIYQYARDKAKADYAAEKDIEFDPASDIEKTAAAGRLGLSLGEYYIIKYVIGQCKGVKDSKGKTVQGSVKAEKVKYLNSIGLSAKQQEIFL